MQGILKMLTLELKKNERDWSVFIPNQFLNLTFLWIKKTKLKSNLELN